MVAKSTVAYLCLVWAVLLLLGLVAGVNLPFILALVGTVLMVLPD